MTLCTNHKGLVATILGSQFPAGQERGGALLARVHFKDSRRHHGQGTIFRSRTCTTGNSRLFCGRRRPSWAGPEYCGAASGGMVCWRSPLFTSPKFVYLVRGCEVYLEVEGLIREPGYRVIDRMPSEGGSQQIKEATHSEPSTNLIIASQERGLSAGKYIHPFLICFRF